MIHQHDAARADADARRERRYLPDHHFRCGACDARQIVVLGEPVTRVAEAIGELRQVERIAQRRRPWSGGRDGREIENRKRDHRARPSLCIAGQMVLVRSATWEERPAGQAALLGARPDERSADGRIDLSGSHSSGPRPTHVPDRGRLLIRRCALGIALSVAIALVGALRVLPVVGRRKSNGPCGPCDHDAGTSRLGDDSRAQGADRPFDTARLVAGDGGRGTGHAAAAGVSGALGCVSGPLRFVAPSAVGSSAG